VAVKRPIESHSFPAGYTPVFTQTWMQSIYKFSATLGGIYVSTVLSTFYFVKMSIPLDQKYAVVRGFFSLQDT
jgi:hypothetical protein